MYTITLLNSCQELRLMDAETHERVILPERRAKIMATKNVKQLLGVPKLKGRWEKKDFGFVRWHGGECIVLDRV